jgi:uncharacterized membrane protein
MKYTRILSYIVLIVYTVGFFGLCSESWRQVFAPLTPVVILLSSLALLLEHKVWPGFKFYIACIVVFLAGYFAEVAGVYTGLVFGHYNYGAGLGPVVFGVPPIIGLNWLVLTFCFSLIFAAGKSLVRKIAAAAAMVCLDVAIEYSAPHLDMWHWHGGSIPLQNYAAWFVLSFVFISLLSPFLLRSKNWFASRLMAAQFLFFAMLSIYFTML